MATRARVASAALRSGHASMLQRRMGVSSAKVDLGVGIAVVSVVLAALALWIGIPAYRHERASTSVDTFRSIRRDLHGRRASHTAGAASLFSDGDRLEQTAYMSAPTWRLREPIPLSSVNVSFFREPKQPRITGRSASTARLLPRAMGGRTRRYSEVIGSDDELRPGLWWDAPSYDLLSFVATDGRVDIACSSAQYFEMVDVCEAVAHEYVHHRGDKDVPKRRSLRFRSEIDDPFDIRRRPFVPAIPTLVLLRHASGPATFLLHARDGAAVASASGLKHLFGDSSNPPHDIRLSTPTRQTSGWQWPANLPRRCSTSRTRTEAPVGDCPTPMNPSHRSIACGSRVI